MEWNMTVLDKVSTREMTAINSIFMGVDSTMDPMDPVC